MRSITLRYVLAVLIFCLTWHSRGVAQVFGGNPPFLRWMQINTDTARIIFPRGLEQQARDVAGIVHRLAATTGYSIGGTVRKINIVMQNQTTVSNGYVSLAPYRSEFFLTPDPNSFELGSLPWHKTLALHEYRHVQQNNNFRKGLTRAFYYVFGEEGQSLASNLAVPDWFWEGDAVYQETLMSEQGRGRIPFFYNDFRSLWASGKNYSWMKLRNGSYRDFTPDHYRLGYLIVSYGRERFDDTLWAQVTDHAVRFKGLFYPFQKAIQSVTGESFVQFRSEAIAHFQKGIVAGADSAAAFAQQHRHFVGDQQYPQWLNDHQFIYLKSSYRQLPAFYVRNILGDERKVALRHISSDDYFSYRNGRIVYSAFRRDARWGWRDYRVVNVLDVGTGKTRTLTHRTKYFSPDISEDGRSVLALRFSADGSSGLDVLDASSGAVLHTVPNPRHFIFTFPKFVGKNQVAAAVRDRAGKMALGVFDLQTGDAKWVTGFSFRTIGDVHTDGDSISFTMSSGLREELFTAIHGRVYRLVTREINQSTGNYQLAVNGNQAVFSAYTAVGYRVFVAPALFEEYSDIPSSETSDSESNGLVLGNKWQNRDFAVSTYPADYHLFHFHSWRPYISDPEYSYSLVGENILNTLQTEVYATYNRNERYKQIGADLAYARWFPVLSLGGSYLFDRAARDQQDRLITWNEVNAHVGLSIPLSSVSGTYRQSVRLSTLLNIQQIGYTGPWKSLYANRSISYGELALSAANQQASARQQIYPRFAQTVLVRYRDAVNKYRANQLLLAGALYFPGLSANHSLVVQAAYQRRDTLGEYSFTNGFPISRGYGDIDFPRMWKLAINYHFPVAYPDAGFGNILYLLRVRSNCYFDYSTVKSLRTQMLRTFRSTGLECYVDTRWWNELPLTLGIRYARLLDKDLTGRSANQWELVLPLDLLSR